MKVLYLDSDQTMRDYVSMCMETGLECEILEASSGNEALVVLQLESDFNFVLTEVELSGGGVEPVLQYLDDNNICCPVIWISKPENESNKTIKKYLEEHDNSGFIPKPFKDQDFFPILEEAMKYEPPEVDLDEEDAKFDFFSDDGSNQASSTNSLFDQSPQSNSLFDNVNQQNNNKTSKQTKDVYIFENENNKVDTTWSTSKKKKNPYADYEPDANDLYGERAKKHKNLNQEEVADWSLAKEEKVMNSEEEADWSTGKLSEEELKRRREMVEEADWSLAKEEKEKNAMEEADWSLAKEEKDKNTEEEADWSLKDPNEEEKQKQKGMVENADWSLEKDQKPGEADWTIPKKESQGGGLSVEARPEEDPDSAKKQEAKEKFQLMEQVMTAPTRDILKKSRRQRIKESNEDADYDKSKYKRIRIKRVLNFDILPCKVFIKIGKAKYLKVIHADEEYSIESIKNYRDKNVRYLYILTEEHPKFMDFFGDVIMDMLKTAKGVGGQAKSMAELVGFDHVLSQAKNIGISERTAKVVTSVIESNIETLESMAGVKDVIKNMLQGNNYISEHSLVLSYICGQISMKTNWHSRSNLEKLSMAAMLHDCHFEDANLAEIHDLDPEQVKDLDKEDQDIVSAHPGEAAKVISQGTNIFPDVDTIVLQHHETVSADGYPRKLGPLTISPLSCIFILAHEFTNEIFKKGKENVDYEEVKKEFKEKFSKGNFKKSVDAFTKAF